LTFEKSQKTQDVKEGLKMILKTAFEQTADVSSRKEEARQMV
jgi:hypothetical protein